MRRIFHTIAGLVLLALGPAARANDDYKLGPDSQPKANVPHGTVTHATYTSAKVYPGTVRDYWVYVPAQYDASKPACLMVFQDGGGFADVNGQFRVPVVFDNLIATGDIPVTIAVMINPGVCPALGPNAIPRFNRSVEYDTPNATYDRFLETELLPEVYKKYKITDDPNGRAICGASSGGISAFTAAWERPDLFRRVISFVGSFTDLHGGNVYPSKIRKTEPKPLRVLLQDGINDQDIYSGSWYLGNSDVAAALRFAGYDYSFVTGDGGHNGKQGGAILPDSLRWLWHYYPDPIKPNGKTAQPVMEVLAADEEWKQVENAPKGDRLSIDGNGLLAITQHRVQRHGLGETRFIILNSKRIYVANLIDGTVYVNDSKNHNRRVTDRIEALRSIIVSPDQTLLIADTDVVGVGAYSFRIQPDGTLTDKQVFFDLQVPYGLGKNGAGDMVYDDQGRLYVASAAGIQVLDQAGRVIGIINSPSREPITSVTFGGPDRSILYAAAGGRIYQRKTKVHGVEPSLPPIKPPLPRL